MAKRGYSRTYASVIMRSIIGLVVFAFFLFWFGLSAPATSESEQPETRTVDVVDVYHGVEVADPYRWLEDGQSEETRAWIDAQNEHTRLLLDALPNRNQIKEQLSRLALADVISYLRLYDGGYIFHKREAGQELPRICLREGLSGEDEVLESRLSVDPRRGWRAAPPLQIAHSPPRQEGRSDKPVLQLLCGETEVTEHTLPNQLLSQHGQGQVDPMQCLWVGGG